MNRAEAWSLLCEWTLTDSLRKHALAVEAAMRGYARKFGEDEEVWGTVGLLHDMDYEKHPTREEHPFVGVAHLRSIAVPEEWCRAILAHADYSGVEPETLMAKTLLASDELTGLITATALVQPSKSVKDVKVSSVVKRMKEKAFARAVNREDIVRGAELLGLSLEEHVTTVLQAMQAAEPA